MNRLVPLLPICILLAACSSHTAPAASSAAAPAPATTNALAGTPMATYGHDLNRAKSVDKVIEQSARKQDAAIEAAIASSSGN